jgi:hypothetical protein
MRHIASVTMRDLVNLLCSDQCAGRAPRTPGSKIARDAIVRSLAGAGLDPVEQPVPALGGSNVLATIEGEIDRYVLLAAHYDHLGSSGGSIYRGADDNAAAVAILVEVASALARAKPRGRGVLIAAFDGEELLYFFMFVMGSEHFARNPIVPLDRIDLMVCMDLVGHALGGPDFPGSVRDTVFALGAEREIGTREIVEEIGSAEPGVIVRGVDAETIPPLSDYAAFWTRERPFVLLTNGRSRVYHTPEDTPELLAWDKMGATARWLERFVRASCARSEAPFVFRDQRDDVSTLDSFIEVVSALAEHSPEARAGLQIARELRGACRGDRSLPEAMRTTLAMLVSALEDGLA